MGFRAVKRLPRGRLIVISSSRLSVAAFRWLADEWGTRPHLVAWDVDYIGGFSRSRVEPMDLQDWRAERSTVLARTSYLLNNPLLSDVTFTVGADQGMHQPYFAHRFILAMNSPVFEAMFYREMAEKERDIEVPDVTPQGFFAMLRYMYTDVVLLETIMEALETFYAARKYMIPYLQEQCERFIVYETNPDSVCRVYEFATMMDLHAVLYKCLRLFDQRIKDVLGTEDFKAAQFFTVQTIVRRPFLTSISEIHIFKAVLQWAREECLRRGLADDGVHLRQVLNPLLPHIRFLNMSPFEFASTAIDQGILTQEEAYPILVKLVTPRCTAVEVSAKFFNRQKPRLPVTHCTCRTYRTRLDTPVRQIQGNDLFSLRFRLDRTDVFLIGVSIPILFPGRRYGTPYVSVTTRCKYINPERRHMEFNRDVIPHAYKEPIITFPSPLFVREGESLEIQAEIDSHKFHPYVYIYKYEEELEKSVWGEVEFTFMPDEPGSSTFQISAIQFYY